MIANKHKATVILGVVSVAFFITYPFRHTFMGGLLSGGFGAAMIGGMADWFAVTALFRRPLGIPYRTAIVPRNRQKIFQALVDMVENQLLMKENIKARLNECDIAGTLVKVMIEHDGKNVVKRMLYSFIREILVQVQPKELGKIIEDVVQDTARKTPITLYLIGAIEWLIKNNYEHKVMLFILKQCHILAEYKQTQELFAQLFIAARKRYEQGMTRRKIFNQLLQLSPEEVGRMGQQALLTMLNKMQDDQHPVRKKAKARLQQWLIEKKTDQLFQEKIEKWICGFLDQAHIGQYGEKYIREFCAEALANNRQTVKWLDVLIGAFDTRMVSLAENEDERSKFDAAVKKMLSNSLDNYHDQIGNIVMDNLNQFTDKMLVEFIENKVGNDLQMVRINGSVVGGLVGMVLYILTFWL